MTHTTLHRRGPARCSPRRCSRSHRRARPAGRRPRSTGETGKRSASAPTPALRLRRQRRQGGVSVALCQRIGEAVKAVEAAETATWSSCRLPRRTADLLRQGKIDLSCGTDTPTLERRARRLLDPDLSAGVGALMRIDGDRWSRTSSPAVARRPPPGRQPRRVRRAGVRRSQRHDDREGSDRSA